MIRVEPCGPWIAACDQCDDESYLGDERYARAWANEHRCKGRRECGCPARLGPANTARGHYAGYESAPPAPPPMAWTEAEERAFILGTRADEA